MKKLKKITTVLLITFILTATSAISSFAYQICDCGGKIQVTTELIGTTTETKKCPNNISTCTCYRKVYHYRKTYDCNNCPLHEYIDTTKYGSWTHSVCKN